MDNSYLFHFKISGNPDLSKLKNNNGSYVNDKNHPITIKFYWVDGGNSGVYQQMIYPGQSLKKVQNGNLHTQDVWEFSKIPKDWL